MLYHVAKSQNHYGWYNDISLTATFDSWSNLNVQLHAFVLFCFVLLNLYLDRNSASQNSCGLILSLSSTPSTVSLKFHRITV